MLTLELAQGACNTGAGSGAFALAEATISATLTIRRDMRLRGFFSLERTGKGDIQKEQDEDQGPRMSGQTGKKLDLAS